MRGHLDLSVPIVKRGKRLVKEQIMGREAQG